MSDYDFLIFDLSKTGRRGATVPRGVGEAPIPFGDGGKCWRGTAPALPEVSEPDVVRHYTRLSGLNFGVDSGFYPLGSCTMKYNPKICDEVPALFAGLHPLQEDETAAGARELLSETERFLCALTGMKHFTFSPCAGAHGELTGLMIIRRYHEMRGDTARTRILVPDSAHGTNPASAAVCGLEPVTVPSGPDGLVDPEALRPLLGPDIAGIMLTNPNTLGLFEKHIREIAEMVHGCGGLLYYDGANLNPLVGVLRPGDMGFDVMHVNLHKTFATPHGGGGPGSGPVGVCAALKDALAQVDGKVSAFHGNFGVVVRSYAYLLMLGREHVKELGPFATLAANYVKESLRDRYKLPIDSVCKHEFVFDGLIDDGAREGVSGATTLDVAKRLLDYGYHAPTIYFPLLFHQSMMIEPTETESLETLDAFIAVMRRIADEAAEDPSLLKEAPHHTPIGRPDETEAARHPILQYKPEA